MTLIKDTYSCVKFKKKNCLYLTYFQNKNEKNFFFLFLFHSSINRHSNGIDKQKTFVRIHVIEMKLYFIILKKKQFLSKSTRVCT